MLIPHEGTGQTEVWVQRGALGPGLHVGVLMMRDDDAAAFEAMCEHWTRWQDETEEQA